MPVNTSGIYIPGKLKIEDATATPSDVMNGKIFYNNNGRQSGTLTTDVVKTYSFTLPSNGEMQQLIDIETGWIEVYFDIDGCISVEGASSANYMDYQWMMYVDYGLKYIKSISINNVKSEVYCSSVIYNSHENRAMNVTWEYRLYTKPYLSKNFYGRFLAHNGYLYGITGEMGHAAITLEYV